MHRTDLRRWHIWSLPRLLLTYVLAVDVAAGVAVGSTIPFTQLTGTSWLWLALLCGATVVHLEAAQGIERIREVAAEGGGYTHPQSVWFFAGVLLLPLPLLSLLVLVSFTHEWFRVYRGRALAHRKVFSAATVVLAVGGAQLVLAALYPGVGQPYVAVLTGPLGALAVVLAGLVYRATNLGLVVGALIGSNPSAPAGPMLGPAGDHLIICACIGLGYAVANYLRVDPWAAPILMVAVLALHMGLLLPQFRAASRTDSKTGLADSGWWADRAAEHLDRARRLESSAGVLMIDIDHFKQVNDRYGHAAGDAVLRAVADTLRHTVRSYDLVGRWGGEEFVVMLPGVDREGLAAAAERIRTAVASARPEITDRAGVTVTVPTSVSVGAGLYPDHAGELSQLLLAVDAALYEAKASGRNRSVLATAGGSLPSSP